MRRIESNPYNQSRLRGASCGCKYNTLHSKRDAENVNTHCKTGLGGGDDEEKLRRNALANNQQYCCARSNSAATFRSVSEQPRPSHHRQLARPALSLSRRCVLSSDIGSSLDRCGTLYGTPCHSPRYGSDAGFRVWMIRAGLISCANRNPAPQFI